MGLAVLWWLRILMLWGDFEIRVLLFFAGSF